MELYPRRSFLRPRGQPQRGPAAGGYGRLRASGLCGHGPGTIRHHLGASSAHRRRTGRASLRHAPDGTDHRQGPQHRAPRLGTVLCAPQGRAELVPRLGASRRSGQGHRASQSAGEGPRGLPAARGSGGRPCLSDGPCGGGEGDGPRHHGRRPAGGGIAGSPAGQGLPHRPRPGERREIPHEGQDLREGMDV